MQSFLQILTLPNNSSFISSSIDRKWLEIGWHQHPEFELILCTSGSIIAYIENDKILLGTGDLLFIKSHILHTLKRDSEPFKGIILQFCRDFMGNHFFNLPECINIKKLLDGTTKYLKISSNTNIQLRIQLKSLITATHIDRITLILQCLETISKIKSNQIPSQPELTNKPNKTLFLYNVIGFTNEHFQEHLTIKQVASTACMSIPSFCFYFKYHTNKTYIDYLNEVRVHYACKLLQTTNKSVTDIGYESGYNTIANFHRQFLKCKKTTPLQYRKLYLSNYKPKETTRYQEY